MALSTEFQEMLFPYEEVRPIQEDLLRKINHAIVSQQNLVVHAPTGLGKTAAALGPCIKEALKKDLTVFFLTSRHTQHKLAMETIGHIKKRYGLDFSYVDIIGKKWLCLQPTVTKLMPRDFSTYCQKIKEDGLCEYYTNTRDKGEGSKLAIQVMNALKSSGRTDTESILEASIANKLCPYEIALLIAKDARVIIGDYYYIFHPSIRDNFMKRTSKDLSKVIVVIDEGHNLPERVKDLASHRINTFIIKRAIEEVKKHSRDDIREFLDAIEENMWRMAQGEQDEKYLKKEDLLVNLRSGFDYDEIMSDAGAIADSIREDQKQSFLGTVVGFLEAWEGDDNGFARILSKGIGLKGEQIVSVHFRCLDPALITRDVIRSAYSTILMSGTLNPTSMYREILGFDSASEETFRSPFPEKNKLNIIIPKTSTKYETRNDAQYKEIGELIARAVAKIPGNVAVFFPSYQLKDAVISYFSKASDKTVFSEKNKFTKKEKFDFLESFKGYKNVGAVLFGVIGGNFGEGIDLPGDFLKGVIIVGLPLQRPDLETESLIKYYDAKFSKGWDYGYLLPAFNKTLQSAGRCIRTETDKGVIIFLDERYAWKNYFRCFPPSWDIKVTLLYEKMIEDFFKKA